MSKTTKLTLSVPVGVVMLAKRYAMQHGTSLSSMVTRLFQALLVLPEGPKNGGAERGKSAVLTESCIGVISLPKKDKRDLISEAIVAKYSKK